MLIINAFKSKFLKPTALVVKPLGDQNKQKTAYYERDCI
jgi:hypothetical protein